MSAPNPMLQDLDVVLPGRAVKEFTWNQLAAQAPVMASTMTRYLDQISVSARPGTVDADRGLQRFAIDLPPHGAGEIVLRTEKLLGSDSAPSRSCWAELVID